MADMILDVENKDAVEEMNDFFSTLTESQLKHMRTTLEGIKLGLQLAEKAAGDKVGNHNESA